MCEVEIKAHPANDEYLDLVDEHDVVIGKKLRSEVYAEHLSNFRVINAFVVNSKGELWIPRRGPNKRIYPLCLDMSVGGHVESGEDYEQAFRRETEEELNIAIDQVLWHKLGHLTPHQDAVSAFMDVYEIKSDKVPDFNRDDFVDFSWLTPDNLIALLEAGEKSKSDLMKLVRIFYG